MDRDVVLLLRLIKKLLVIQVIISLISVLFSQLKFITLMRKLNSN